MYGGLCTPPYLGTPKHNAVVFAYIYKAILHCIFCKNSRYFARFAFLQNAKIAAILHKLYSL